ncbi:LOW QUALITY PROTEIN: hypothetical protein HID58_022304 [Brassica napus]|uniref:HIG1 domain-containing protein n=1 Tax=Brassica napus TaxID=3708 RepID=A0ABQ8CZ39_BRANA|nr:LOW QUALITY PROTEIN: hypothetical protein HID58_022304 [Brassica napus]
MHWALGKGTQIRVWQDNWLLGGTRATPSGPGMLIHPNLRVKDLFAIGSSSWNLPLLQQLFQEEDVHRILRLRSSITGGDDILYWRHSTTGKYTVKSGYHIQMQLDDEDAHPNQVLSLSSNQMQSQIVKKLWTLNIPPKIKIFWWKVLHNALPVATNFVRRVCRINADCQLCGEGLESLSHLLYDCRVTRDILDLACPEVSQSLRLNNDLLQVTQHIILDGARENHGSLPLFLGWWVWKMRNKLLFENTRVHIVQVIKTAIMDQQLWREALLHDEPAVTHTNVTPIQSIDDIPPQEPCFYCIADASWKSPNENAGIGWSLHSTLIIQGSSAIAPTNSALEAEAMAVLLAVQQMHHPQYDNITFLGDNTQLYKSLQHQKERRSHNYYCSEALTMIQDIINLSKLSKFSFRKVPRNLVQGVDLLAKRARLLNHQYMSGIEPDMEDLFQEKKRVRNPLVPLGALATAGVLTAGLISFRRGNSQLGQVLMRARVVVQGATVALMVGTAYYYGLLCLKPMEQKLFHLIFIRSNNSSFEIIHLRAL